MPLELVPGYLGPVPTDPDGRAARTCAFCKGAGKVLKHDDVRAAVKVLEIAGLAGKNRGAVQIMQDFSGASHTSAVAELSSMHRRCRRAGKRGMTCCVAKLGSMPD